MSDSLEKSLTNISKSNIESYQRAKPLVQTVSNLKGATNHLRSFADTVEQLLVAIEGFAPFIEIAAKGKDNFVRAIAPPPRK